MAAVFIETLNKLGRSLKLLAYENECHFQRWTLKLPASANSDPAHEADVTSRPMPSSTVIATDEVASIRVSGLGAWV